MRSEIVHTNLFCLHCEKETPHDISYAGNYLHKIKCTVCGTEIRIDREKILKFYTSEMLRRLISKPERINEEFRRNMSTFLVSLPFRIISKPYRIAKEIFQIVKEGN